ncbi:MAG TPA: porin [Caulobacteraceae bacterium]|jgi:phosphate-selective porin OprO/OprP|nr:porin [Caulobacteraceae bacterium]
MIQSVSRRARISGLALLLAGVSSVAMAQTNGAAPSPASDARDARIEQLEAEVHALADEVHELKQTQIQTIANEPSHALPAARATIDLGKPAIVSADGRFSANFHVIMQLDAAQYDQPSAGPITSDFRRDGPALGATATNVDLAHARQLKDGDDFRRARIGVDGVTFGDWDYRLVLDFGGTGVENTGQLYETWIQYSGLKPFHFRVGAFPPQIGMEDQSSPTALPFLERTASSDLSRSLAAGETRTAAEVFGNGEHWLASAALTGRTIGVISTATGTATPQTYSDQLGFVGRLATTTTFGSGWRVHAGVHGSYVFRPADTTGPAANGATPITGEVIALNGTPELRVDATKLINTGNIDARHADSVGAEFGLQRRNLLLQAEYENFGVDRSDHIASPDFYGYYVEGVWNITGESRTYNASTGAFDAPPIPHPFSLHGPGWGAFELGVRYSELNLNYQPGALGTLQTGSSIRGGDETNFTVGLNWYPNSVVRFMFDYAHVRIDRLNPATSATAASTIWFAPIGAQIGQSYDVFSMRSQFAF